jgi:hypothetical protein
MYLRKGSQKEDCRLEGMRLSSWRTILPVTRRLEELVDCLIRRMGAVGRIFHVAYQIVLLTDRNLQDRHQQAVQYACGESCGRPQKAVVRRQKSSPVCRWKQAVPSVREVWRQARFFGQRPIDRARAYIAFPKKTRQNPAARREAMLAIAAGLFF